MQRAQRVVAVIGLPLITAGLLAASLVVLVAPSAPGVISEGSCTAEEPYEKGPQYGINSYGSDCTRMRFKYGPITVKPGQNDAMIEPIVVQKPPGSGYAVRFEADIVDAASQVQPVGVHLHHAVWLSSNSTSMYQFGGPIFATGEEKTVTTFPTGYGLPVTPNEAWYILYMIQNMTESPREVFITYDIDFVEKSDGERLGVVPVKVIWLDVMQDAPSRIHREFPEHSAYPVINAQRGFGHIDPDLDRRVCTWPRENCARFNPFGASTPQQGRTSDLQGKPFAIGGSDFNITPNYAGTLVWIGGHLHPGGIRDEVSLVRGGIEKPIFISDGLYWREDKPEIATMSPDSWDFSMTTTGAQLGWKVQVKSGDALRINAVYDSEDASWYEVMGIVVALVAPLDPHGKPGVDVFSSSTDLNSSFPTNALNPKGVEAGCEPAESLCLRGQVTHGSIPHAHSAVGGHGVDPNSLKRNGPYVTDVNIQNFGFGSADIEQINTGGIPRVDVGKTVRFWNLDAPGKLWHTVTRCGDSCEGHHLPKPDGGAGSSTDRMDFESGQIGFGGPWDGAKTSFPPQRNSGKSYEQMFRDGMTWEFAAQEPGIYTFYCRNHPSMRGAIEVVGPNAVTASGGASSGGHDHDSGSGGGNTSGSAHHEEGAAASRSSSAGHHSAAVALGSHAHDARKAEVAGVKMSAHADDHLGEATAADAGSTGGTGHHKGGVPTDHQTHLAIALGFVAAAGAAGLVSFVPGRALITRLAAGALALQLGGLGWDMVLHASAGQPIDLLENGGHIISGLGILILGGVVFWSFLPRALTGAIASRFARSRTKSDQSGGVAEIRSKRSA